MSLSPRLRRGLLWAGLVSTVVLVLLLLVLAFIDWNLLKGPIERMASARSGRTVAIGGSLDVHIWSSTPQVKLERLTIGGSPWEAGRPLLQLEKAEVELQLLPLLKGDVILPRVVLVRPQLYLHRDASGRANWTFKSTRPSNAPAGRPPDLPVIKDFRVQSGRLTLRDEILHLDVLGTVEAQEKGSEEHPEAFRLEGKGTLNKEPFALRIVGGPLVNIDPDHPYPFDLRIRAGDIRVNSDGIVREPFDLGRLRLNVRASGGDLADLYYLTQLALPNTPPYILSAEIERNVSHIEVTRIVARVGQSDLRGKLTVDASRKRPMIAGDLSSKELRLSDFAASFGGRRNTDGSIQGKTSAPTSSRSAREPLPAANARLFPDARLQVNRVRAMDAHVRFRSQSIRAGSLPFEEVAVRVNLNEGVLELEPFEFKLPQGQLSGTARIDARREIPVTKLDVRIKGVELDQLKGKAPGAKPPLGGTLLARVVLEGKGDSVHDVMADADGQLYAIVPHGEIRAAFAELTGINVARGLGLLLKDDDERADIRCGIAQFDVREGTMHAQHVVFDTEDVRITGHGEVRLGPEELDLKIKGEPKEFRIGRLRTPVKLGGHLRKPRVGIDAGKTAKQGAIAAALGAVTPIAAILAFVDPGLAKDENCAALLAPVQARTTKAPSEGHRKKAEPGTTRPNN